MSPAESESSGLTSNKLHPDDTQLHHERFDPLSAVAAGGLMDRCVCVTDLWPAPRQSSAPALIGWEVCRAVAVSEGAELELVAIEVEINKQTNLVTVCVPEHQTSELKSRC